VLLLLLLLLSDKAAASSFLTRAISKPLNADHCPEYRLRIQEATAQGKINTKTWKPSNSKTQEPNRTNLKLSTQNPSVDASPDLLDTGRTTFVQVTRDA
jgi:hypothetical protein